MQDYHWHNIFFWFMKNSANIISQNWVYWRTITRRNLPSGSIKTEEVSYLKEWFNQESIYLVRPTDLSSTLWFLRNQDLFSHSKVLEWLKQQINYSDKYQILQELQQNSVKKTDEWMRFWNTVKSQAVDRSTILFWNFLARGHCR